MKSLDLRQGRLSKIQAEFEDFVRVENTTGFGPFTRKIARSFYTNLCGISSSPGEMLLPGIVVP